MQKVNSCRHSLVRVMPLAALIACTQTMPEVYDTYGEEAKVSSAVAVDAVIADSIRFVGTNVTMAGTVHAVCQMKGCWLTLQSLQGESIRVDVARTDEGSYAFTVPTDISGRYAIAHGFLKANTMNEADHQHMAEESDLPLQWASLSMVAAGVMVVEDQSD